MNNHVERLYLLPLLDDRIGRTLENNICYKNNNDVDIKATLIFFVENLQKSIEEINKFIDIIPDDNNFTCSIDRDVAHIIIKGPCDDMKQIKDFVENEE